MRGLLFLKCIILLILISVNLPEYIQLLSICSLNNDQGSGFLLRSVQFQAHAFPHVPCYPGPLHILTLDFGYSQMCLFQSNHW